MNPISGRAGEIARQMLAQQGLGEAEHGVMASNLAMHLAKTPEPILERFEATGGAPSSVLPELIHEAAYMHPSVLRPFLKVERELQSPYTNSQVEQRIETVENRLRERLREHLELNGSYPKQVWVTGSMVHGGFGGNSDADVIFDAGSGYKAIRQEDPLHQVDVMYLMHDHQADQMRFFGEKVEVDVERLLRGESVLKPIAFKSLPAQHYPIKP